MAMKWSKTFPCYFILLFLLTFILTPLCYEKKLRALLRTETL